MRVAPRRWLRLLTLLASAWGISLPAWALQPFTAYYQASYRGMQGEGSLVLERTDAPQQWRVTLTVKNALVRIRQSTLFEAGADTALRPLRSTSDTRIPFQRRVVYGHYNWETRRATWTGDARPSRQGPVVLEDGDMDGLLINLAVMRDLAQDKPLQYRMVDNGRATPLEYQIAGTANVVVNGKHEPATRVERHELNDRNRQQVAWIVSHLPAPVHLLQREDGKDVLALKLDPDRPVDLGTPEQTSR